MEIIIIVCLSYFVYFMLNEFPIWITLSFILFVIITMIYSIYDENRKFGLMKSYREMENKINERKGE